MANSSVGTKARAVLGDRVGFTIVAFLLVIIAAVLPLAINSAYLDFVVAQSDLRYSITPPKTIPGDNYNRVRLVLTGLDEWAGTATIQASGVHICSEGCDHDIRFLLVSVPLQNARQADGLPPAQSVNYPPDAEESSALVTLPVTGNSIRYPFDSYRLRLGVVMQEIFPDKHTEILSPEEADSHVFLTLRNHVSRLDMRAPSAVDPASVRPSRSPYQYVYVQDLTFERPLYLRVMTVLLVVLVAAAASYAVFMRPFDQLVINSGALVLGVWGIRAILLGPGVPGITAVDLALSVVIIFLLVAITVRALQYLAQAGQVNLRLWAHRVPVEQPHEPPQAKAPDKESDLPSPGTTA